MIYLMGRLTLNFELDSNNMEQVVIAVAALDTTGIIDTWLIVFQMEFDKTKWSCSCNSA